MHIITINTSNWFLLPFAAAHQMAWQKQFVFTTVVSRIEGILKCTIRSIFNFNEYHVYNCLICRKNIANEFCWNLNANLIK